MARRKITVFYAWQSDRPQKINRHFIRWALDEAANRIDPDVGRAEPVSQNGERRNLIKPPVRLFLAEDQFLVGVTEMGDRDAVGKHTPLLCMKPPQGCERGKQRIVPPRRVEGERLEEGFRIFADVPILLDRQRQGRSIIEGTDLTSSAGTMTMNVLNAVAQFERDLLIERTQSGLKRTKSEGKALGRPSTLSERQKQNVHDDLATGMSVSAIAKKFASRRQTIMRVREHRS